MDFTALRNQKSRPPAGSFIPKQRLAPRSPIQRSYKQTGNTERYETSRRNAQTALDAIDHFKGRHRMPWRHASNT
jgi:hypothetical protein